MYSGNACLNHRGTGLVLTPPHLGTAKVSMSLSWLGPDTHCVACTYKAGALVPGDLCKARNVSLHHFYEGVHVKGLLRGLWWAQLFQDTRDVRKENIIHPTGDKENIGHGSRVNRTIFFFLIPCLLCLTLCLSNTAVGEPMWTVSYGQVPPVKPSSCSVVEWEAFTDKFRKYCVLFFCLGGTEWKPQHLSRTTQNIPSAQTLTFLGWLLF